MSANTLPRSLEIAQFESTGKAFQIPGTGWMLFWGTSNPTATDQPAKGAIFFNTSNGLWYRNNGTKTVPSWVTGSGLGG